ncbi:ABC transporter ATP-binding protein [Hyphococcus sp.]|uniref:ABC transporter ATP-binding protein n=1 Tax=Hyphococcus sp. TaxID=2038636 RepID=UPI003CCBE4D3
MSLDLKDISHRFGETEALKNASVSVSPGELVCLFGPSGCGKTTLLRIAAGLEPLQAGTVALEGAMLAQPGRETPPEKRPVGLVFQDYVLFPHLTVEKNIAFGLAGASKVRQRVSDQLHAFGIAALAQRYPHELSGGQQQRVALARAMARKPKALLLDEPFASIDVTLRRRLRNELRRTLKEQGAAVLLVTHDPEEALALGDRIALMRGGEIIEAASPENLYRAPATPEGAKIFPGGQIVKGDIRSGFFHSMLGPAPVSGLPDGPGLAVLRAGAISCAPDMAGKFAVAEVRFTGPDWAVWLETEGGDEGITVMQTSPPERAARMNVNIDWSKGFIFAV